jgi:hypothetical protein
MQCHSLFIILSYQLRRIGDEITNNASCSKNKNLIAHIYVLLCNLWIDGLYIPLGPRKQIICREGHVRTQNYLLAVADPEAMYIYAGF